MVKTKHRVTSLVLAVLLAFSMLFIGTTYASAVDTGVIESGSASVIYLKLNSSWGQDSPRFAAYFFGNGAEAWASMTAVSGETDTYSAAVPTSGQWTHVIFVRMNPTTTENNWNNKYNQSGDIALESGKNFLTLDEGWDNMLGTWSVYQGSQPITPTPTPGGASSTIYLKLNSNWGQDSPRFAAYFFGNGAEAWSSMTAVSGE
ncbi:hypothetical protein, partial [Ruminococcus sp. zg-921]